MMRLELLIQHGGIFLDHDAYVLRSLEPLRRCCPTSSYESSRSSSGTPSRTTQGSANQKEAIPAKGCHAATVVAGFEQATESLRKLNPGVLLAEKGSRFLTLARASWRNYSTAWDFNCCEAAYRLHAAHPELGSHLRADIGPLPRYATEMEYAEHIERARVVRPCRLCAEYVQR
jgi:hypothetical protein